MQYASSADAFVSLGMLSAVALCPQVVASTKRRRLNAGGSQVPGAGDISTERIKGTLKTWPKRILTARDFTSFIGGTICTNTGAERPSDAGIERVIRTFSTYVKPGAYEDTNFRTTRTYSTPAFFESDNIFATSS